MLESKVATPIFVESEGGPLIIIGSASLADWEGIDAPSGGRVVESEFRWNGPGSSATDYDRACDVDGYVGVFALGTVNEVSDALVFGGEPLSSTILKIDQTSPPLIVRCNYRESEEALLTALSAISDRLMSNWTWEDQGIPFAVTSNPLFLFDSAIRGSEAASSLEDNSIPFDLPIGNYRIARYQFDATSETCLDLYRFEPG